MKLAQLALELGMDPLALLELLIKSPTPFFESGPTVVLGDFYAIKILPHRVEDARKFVTTQSAQEVINHVKEKGSQSPVFDPFYLSNDDEEDD